MYHLNIKKTPRIGVRGA